MSPERRLLLRLGAVAFIVLGLAFLASQLLGAGKTRSIVHEPTSERLSEPEAPPPLPSIEIREECLPRSPVLDLAQAGPGLRLQLLTPLAELPERGHLLRVDGSRVALIFDAEGSSRLWIQAVRPEFWGGVQREGLLKGLERLCWQLKLRPAELHVEGAGSEALAPLLTWVRGR
ncbi:MAG: hypothetical protein CSA62_04570 [Planctomycetota bacterium]|nr:MAG: hypothetical protein CSA62_04570 [Planctomycetota bacterium]